MPALLKLLPGLLVLVLLATITVLTNQLHHKKQELSVERTQRSELAKIVGAEDNWVSIRTHSRDLVISVEHQQKALDEISKRTLEAKARADAADAALAREQADNQRKFAALQQTLDRLQHQTSSGNQAIDDQVIEEISKLPYTNWKLVASIHTEETRYDYNHMTNPKLYAVRPVMLVTYPNQKVLQKSFQMHYHVSDEQLGKVITLAYSVLDRNDGVCEIHIVDPRVQWDSDKRNSMGHELAHCFYGYWHGAVG